MKPEKLPGVSGLKEALRRQMRAALGAMAEEARAQASLKICREAGALPAFREAQTVAFFTPLATEPDIHPLVEEAWAQGKRIAFPLMSREGGVPRLDWHAATSWDDLVMTGPFGIREPDPARCARVASDELDLIFVPGLAFDARGVRLGRGGGYYDVALAALDVGTPRLGLFFARQQAPEIPRDAHDQMLTGVVTESGLTSSM
jgi:5-formyltetrahydrofolate cyclo-ligase